MLMINRELLTESVSRLEMELNESNHKLELRIATNELKVVKLEAELKQAINKLEAANLKWELKEAENNREATNLKRELKEVKKYLQCNKHPFAAI